MQLSSPIVILKITPRHSGCVRQSTLHSTRDLEIKCSKSHKHVHELFVRCYDVVTLYVRSGFIKCVYLVFIRFIFLMSLYESATRILSQASVNNSLIIVNNSSQELAQSIQESVNREANFVNIFYDLVWYDFSINDSSQFLGI